jgi:4-oxalocrotonate tautomerase
MPLVRIDLEAGKPASHRRAIGDAIHDAMVATINVPEHDRFQIFTEHPQDGLVVDREYLGIARTRACVVIQITMNLGRTLQQKRDLYKAIADGLASRAALRREDVFVNLVEVAKENWSFGNGEAQYA